MAALSQANQDYLTRIKNDITTRSNGETIRSNALAQLDRRLSSKELTPDQYSFLKNEISGVQKTGGASPTQFQNATSGPYTLQNAQANGYVQPTNIVGTQTDTTKLAGATSNPTVNSGNTSSTSGGGSTVATEEKKAYTPVGEISTANPNVAAFEATGKAMEDHAANYATDIEKNANKYALREQDLIKQRDSSKRTRSDQQEKELAEIEANAEKNIDARRKDADLLVNQQNTIASRNANISAAQATQSGLQLSQGEVDSIRNDTMAKYGTNIMNATDFKNKTNLNLDEALTKLNLDVFQKQSDIDNFRNLLDNEEFAPVLNAVKAASEGNKKAIDDVYTYYTEFTKKKAEEEYNRMMKTERYIAEEKEFQEAPLALKEKVLYDKINEIPGFQYVAQDIGAIMNQYPNASMTFLMSTIVEKAMKNQDSRNLILAAVQTGKVALPEDLKNSILAQNTKEVNAANTTVAQNINNETVAAQNNPGTEYRATGTNTFNDSKTNTTNNSTATPTYSLSQKNLDYINTIKTNMAKSPDRKASILKNATTLLGNQLKIGTVTQAQYDAIISALNS